MKIKRRILIGYIQDGHAGGVDKYILTLISSVQRDLYDIDLLTSQINLELYEELKEQNINLYEIPTLKHPLKQYKCIKRIIEANKYDVTYFNISTAIHCIGLLAAKRCKVKNRVVHSHSAGVDIENKYKRYIMTALHTVCKRAISNSATTFIACSQKAGEWLFAPSVIKKDNYSVVHNSVDLKKFTFDVNTRKIMREKMGWTGKKVLIHVANFTYQKNNEFMIEVYKRAREIQRDLVLVLIGKGSKEEKIKTLVKNYELDDSVLFLKNITNVDEYLQAADLFLLPSFFEGYPISALEAQATGLPCILSDKITSESKITDRCVFKPLKIEDWIEEILSALGSNSRRGQHNISEFDNSELCAKIERLWCKKV